VDGTPAACGGWRAHETDVELKRMYVSPSFRGRGLARAVLRALEQTAAKAGYHRVILETGSKQPEAIALYESSGYRRVPSFGYYKDAPGAVHLGKAVEIECPSTP
jgi:GNAT superfamily N-acetyltransferase